MNTSHKYLNRLMVMGCSIAFLSHFGCNKRDTELTSSKSVSEENPSTDAQESPEKFLIKYLETPDEAHYQQIVTASRFSARSSFVVIWNYNESSKRMQPVDDPTVDQESVDDLLIKCSADDFIPLAKIMLKHPDPWRRWTMATVIGKFAGRSAIPYLEELLNDSEQSVQQHARQAIQSIHSRYP